MPSVSGTTSRPPPSPASKAAVKPGVRLLDTFNANCAVCHALRPPSPNGPLAAAVASHYRSEHANKPAFLNAIKSFVQDPAKARPLMPPAVNEFGMMPKLDYAANVIEEAAELMWTLGTGAEPLPPAPPAEARVAQLPRGGQLFVQNCGVCHSLEPPPRNGPPARGLSRNYQRAFPEQPAFVEAVVAFVNEPVRGKAVMPQAVQRFGLMPQMRFDQAELRATAAWLYSVAPRRGFRGGRGGFLAPSNSGLEGLAPQRE